MPEPTDPLLPQSLIFRAALDRPARMVSWNAFQRGVDALAETIRASGIAPSALVGVFQGGWIVAQCLGDHFPGVAVLGAVARPGGPGNAGLELFAARDGILTEVRPVPGSEVVLVDEVVDSGRTARFYLDHLRQFDVRPWLACLAADTHADPVPDFAADRIEHLPALVLPWRVQRDFAQTATCLLTAEPLTTDQIDERLRELGYDIPSGILDARLHDLIAQGRIRLAADRRWHRNHP